MDIIEWLLNHREKISATDISCFDAWKRIYDAATVEWTEPIDRAVIGGFLADRAAYAFAAGYESALARLVPSLPAGVIVSFCITEEKGGHPASIKSSLRKNEDPAPQAAWLLSGSKKFITMASEAEILLVAASAGVSSDGKNMIRMVMVNRSVPGIAITPMNGLPFVPEISHGTVSFTNVSVNDSDILPGDGYLEYIKPFRTIEDLHVFTAIAGFFFRIASLYRWPRAFSEQVLSLLVCSRTLAREDPVSPATHIALGGLNEQIMTLLESASKYWNMTNEIVRSRWERDRALLNVAETARAKRLDTAWSKY